VYASGCNTDTQLGMGTGILSTQTPQKVTALLNYNVVKVEASHTSACVTDQGDLFLWGSGIFGEYPFP